MIIIPWNIIRLLFKCPLSVPSSESLAHLCLTTCVQTGNFKSIPLQPHFTMFMHSIKIWSFWPDVGIFVSILFTKFLYLSLVVVIISSSKIGSLWIIIKSIVFVNNLGLKYWYFSGLVYGLCLDSKYYKFGNGISKSIKLRNIPLRKKKCNKNTMYVFCSYWL